MIIQELNENWTMHEAGTVVSYPALVPGSVYGDLLRNQVMEDPFWKDNEDKALALMEKDYEYHTIFQAAEELLLADRILLRMEGLDTLAEVRLNGKKILDTDNMHRLWEIDVTDNIRPEDNWLTILFHSPTKYIREAFAKNPTRGSEDCMPGFVHLRKAHCMFGWDWGAHLPDAGIFRPIKLLGITKARLEEVHITQLHGEKDVRLRLDVKSLMFFEPIKAEYRVTVTSPVGEVLEFTDSPTEIQIDRPMLWWPNGYGEQNLYHIRVTLYVEDEAVDRWERRIGLRTMTVKREKDSWGESFAFTVNGISIFAMGADYIPEDHLLGRVTPETTRTLLEKAKFANFNSIRVWGGGYYPDDWFYDICDELGLVVWQDFMFACAMYDLTPEFEKSIRAEIRDNILRLRHHASLGLWCGNNEMEMFTDSGAWISKASEVRDYILMYERIIPELVKKYSPEVFYWPASPSSGGSFDEPNAENRGDVHYWDVWHGNKPFTEYRKFYFRYLSEFGFQSFPSEKTIETFTDDERDKNIFSYIMEKHQRNGAANGKIMNYMQQTYLYPTDFSTLLYASQLLQADAIRYGVEHYRRNRGRCMGAIYWQLNDCWPVASWSSIDYAGRLKALHYYAKRFFAPVMLSCEEEGMMSSGQVLNWIPFEFEKSIRLSIANETRCAAEGVLRWQIRNADASIEREEEEWVLIEPLSSKWLEKVMLPDIDIYCQYVSYSFEQEGNIVSEGTVIFSYPKYFQFEDPELTCEIAGNELIIRASSYARSVEIRNAEDNLILSDNYFDMNAGEKRIRIISGEPVDITLRSVYDIR